MLSLEHYQSAFKALSHRVRLKLFDLIYRESLFCDLNESPPLSRNTINDLARLMKLSESTISHHINLMRSAHLITGKRVGNSVYLFPDANLFKLLADVQKKLEIKSDKIITQIDLPKQVELSGFTEATEFIELHGYNLTGPTRLKTEEGSARYLLMSRRDPLRKIEITYTPHNGKIELARLDSPETAKMSARITELYSKFFK